MMFIQEMRQAISLTLFLLSFVLGPLPEAKAALRCQSLFLPSDQEIQLALIRLGEFRAEISQTRNEMQKQRLIEEFDTKVEELHSLVSDPAAVDQLVQQAILQNQDPKSKKMLKRRQAKENEERLQEEKKRLTQWQKAFTTSAFLQNYSQGFKLTHDGTKLVTFSPKNRKTRIFDTETLKEIHLPGIQVADQFVLAGKSSKLLLISRFEIEIWDLDHLSMTTESNFLGGDFYQVEVSDDASRILARDNMGHVKLYDVSSKTEIPLKMDNPDLDWIILSSDGHQVVTSDLKQVLIHDTRTGKTFPFTAPFADGAKIKQILRSPDNKLWVLSEKNILYSYDFVSGQNSVLDIERRDVVNVMFSPDGSRILLGGRDFLSRFDLKTQALETETFQLPKGEVLGHPVATPNLEWTTTQFKNLRAFDPNFGDIVLPFSDQIDTIQAHPDGKRFFITDWEGRLHIWFMNEADFHQYHTKMRQP